MVPLALLLRLAAETAAPALLDMQAPSSPSGPAISCSSGICPTFVYQK